MGDNSLGKDSGDQLLGVEGAEWSESTREGVACPCKFPRGWRELMKEENSAQASLYYRQSSIMSAPWTYTAGLQRICKVPLLTHERPSMVKPKVTLGRGLWYTSIARWRPGSIPDRGILSNRTAILQLREWEGCGCWYCAGGDILNQWCYCCLMCRSVGADIKDNGYIWILRGCPQGTGTDRCPNDFRPAVPNR